MKIMPRHAVNACLFLLLLMSAACAPSPSPLQRDFERVTPGMNAAQVEAIMGKYLKQGEGNSGDPSAPNFSPLGGINKNDITYPLGDDAESTRSEQRCYRARTRRGDWEFAFIELKDGRVTSARLLR